jgi:tetratricopeptide (TPR) repeat protein
VSPEERTDAETKADRALRRGELSTALTLYQSISKAFPTDDAISKKLERIRENLQPMELSSAKTRVPLDQAPPPTNSIQSAEALAAKGDYAGAIALYQRSLQKRPDSPLIKERLEELIRLAESMAPRDPIAVTREAIAAEKEAPQPTLQEAVREAQQVVRGAQASREVPVSTARLLSDLLDQISRRRRTRPSGA